MADVVTRARLVLDSGGVSAIATGNLDARDTLQRARRLGYEVVIPTPVLAEVYSGRSIDAPIHRVVKEVELVIPTSASVARRAGELRARSGVTDVVDAIVVAEAATTPGSIVLTSDPADIRALIDATGTPRVACVGV